MNTDFGVVVQVKNGKLTEKSLDEIVRTVPEGRLVVICRKVDRHLKQELQRKPRGWKNLQEIIEEEDLRRWESHCRGDGKLGEELVNLTDKLVRREFPSADRRDKLQAFFLERHYGEDVLAGALKLFGS